MCRSARSNRGSTSRSRPSRTTIESRTYSVREPFGRLARLNVQELEMDDRDQELETLPPALVSGLKARDRAQPIVDPRTDRAVLDAARAYFEQRPVSTARQRRRFAVPLGAAAAVLLAVVVVHSFG